MYTGRYPMGYAGRVTELEKGPRGLRRGRGARERILSASQQLFRDQGINRTGIDQICAVAEVSKRTLYQHFTGKDELIAECLRRFDPDVLPEVFDRTDLTPRATTPRRLRHPLASVPVHRSGRRNTRPGPPGTRLRPRLQGSLCRAAHRYRPRGWRHRPRTARRTTGVAAGWCLGPQPSPRRRDPRHRRRHRGRPRRQRHPYVRGTAAVRYGRKCLIEDRLLLRAVTRSREKYPKPADSTAAPAGVRTLMASASVASLFPKGT